VKLRHLGLPAAVIAAAALSFSPAASATTAVHQEFRVPRGSHYVRVEIPFIHGQLVRSNVAYADDHYQHADIISAASKVSEIDNYTGLQPDTSGIDGCANTRQPDELFATDVDKYGIPGKQVPTSLHHDVHLTFTPKNNGKAGYHWFLWCHYEHGPETWIALTFQDGSTIEVYWNVPTSWNEMILVHGGTAVTVTPVPND
jgi:hypothetical protein